VPREAPAGFVEWLGSAEGDVRTLGGKAASLDRLARLGFRTPAGFCLTTSAFRQQLGALPEAGVSISGLPDEAARQALVTAVETTPLPSEVSEGLDVALRRLIAEATVPGDGPPTFAVRSSGVGEDSANASFAGLHETELGVSPGDVPAAIRRCWASLWSAPAIAYRAHRGLPLDGGAMAVVVQALVPAEAAAVAFSRHPVTGREDQLVITAVRGFGDAMVAGTVTPDTIVVDRATLGILEWALADRTAGPALSDGLLRELVALVLGVEQRFGAPVDIEAAVGGGDWFLLQARPITTS